MSEISKVPREPEEFKSWLREFHEGNMTVDPPEVDRAIFGTTCTSYDSELFARFSYNTDTPSEERLGKIKIRHKAYGRETTWGPGSETIWTPYEVGRDVAKVLDINAEDKFYDLGSGYGRMPIYAGITTGADCTGIELVRERTELTNEAIARLGLANVRTLNGDINGIDFSDGNKFYMYAPFNRDTTDAVVNELVQLAEQKPIRVAMRATKYILERHSMTFEQYHESCIPHGANERRQGLSNVYYFQSK